MDEQNKQEERPDTREWATVSPQPPRPASPPSKPAVAGGDYQPSQPTVLATAHHRWVQRARVC